LPLLAADAPHPQKLTNQHHLDGAGCSFQLEGAPDEGADVFQWDFDKEAWLNLGDRDVRVDVISMRDIPSNRGSKGDRRVLTLRKMDVRMTIDTRKTSTCAETDESCEAWSESGTITIEAAKEKSVTRVKGTCGS